MSAEQAAGPSLPNRPTLSEDARRIAESFSTRPVSRLLLVGLVRVGEAFGVVVAGTMWLIGQWHERNLRHHRDEVEKLLELAEQKKGRFLMASTSECYGDPAIHPQPESYWGNVNPIGMRSMYDEAKRFSEACTMAYHRERGVATRLIRIFNTYGPRMDPYDGRVVISFIRQALNNEPLTVFGDGLQTRSLCYVSDLVRGINLVMESDFIEPINLGNPNELTILDIAKEVLALIPESTSTIVHQPMPPDDPKVRKPDISRAKAVLGWEPVVSRKEGLAKMIEFYRDTLVKKHSAA